MNTNKELTGIELNFLLNNIEDNNTFIKNEWDKLFNQLTKQFDISTAFEIIFNNFDS